MATHFELPQEVLAIFREEAREHLEAVAVGLAQLGAADEPAVEAEHRANLKRKLHNVKGAAHSVGFAELGRVAHAAEDRLATVADELEVPPGVIDDLYAAVHWLLSTLDEPKPPPAPLRRRLGLAAEGADEAEAEAEAEAERPGNRSAAPRSSAAYVRVESSALEQLLSPLAALAMLRVQGRREAGRLEELSHQLLGLADNAAKGTLGPRELDALRELGRELERRHRRAREAGRRTDLALGDLEEQLRRMRLVPFQSIEPSLRLTLREAASATFKKVELVIRGGEAGLDRRHLELLKSPLVHLLRNAVDHGIELPAERAAAGEDETGTILLQLEAGADRITVVVEDDGRGMDLPAIRRKALARGLATTEELEAMTPGRLHELACTPGFSTRDAITELSGRGVGLDVVRSVVEHEGGSLSIEARTPKGSRFLLSLPASLITSNVLRVAAGDSVYALPVAGVESTSRIDPATIYTLDGRPCVEVGGRSALVHRLQGTRTGEADGDRRNHAVVIATPRGRVAVLVDRILGYDEMVVRALGPPYRKVRGVLGATVSDEGRVVPVLNPAEIFEIDQEQLRAAGPQQAARRRSILVVDDSITTRTLERHVLESQGFLVETASDGAAALELLRGKPFDLVVSDVEMPVLDGIGLVRSLRADPGLGGLPIVLVTSLGSATDEARGRAAGANAYIVKSRFDQTVLLDTIAALLGGAG